MTPAVLTLYQRKGCHLCTGMRSALRPWVGSRRIQVRLVDVDQDPQLVRRYGELVPVLESGGVEICHYFLDEERLECFLAGD